MNNSQRDGPQNADSQGEICHYRTPRGSALPTVNRWYDENKLLSKNHYQGDPGTCGIRHNDFRGYIDLLQEEQDTLNRAALEKSQKVTTDVIRPTWKKAACDEEISKEEQWKMLDAEDYLLQDAVYY